MGKLILLWRWRDEWEVKREGGHWRDFLLFCHLFCIKGDWSEKKWLCLEWTRLKIKGCWRWRRGTAIDWPFWMSHSIGQQEPVSLALLSVTPTPRYVCSTCERNFKLLPFPCITWIFLKSFWELFICPVSMAAWHMFLEWSSSLPVI